MMKRNGRNVCSLKTLVGLEAEKGNLRPFHPASGIIALCLPGMLYLFAAIPHFDPADAGAALITAAAVPAVLDLLIRVEEMEG